MFTSQTINDLIHSGEAVRIATEKLMAPTNIWWELEPGTIHTWDGGNTWARARVYVEWANGTYVQALIRVCELGVQVDNVGHAPVIDYLVADVFRHHLTEEAAHRMECAAIRANDAWKDGICGQDGGPCGCGALLPVVRHPQDGCPDCDRAWTELYARA